MKRPQGGNGRVLAKWGENERVRVQGVFKNKFTKVFHTVLGV